VNQLISIEEKKVFLKWFIDSYELKQRECLWLLNYILNDDRLLSLLKFVQSVAVCPRAMVIRTKTIPGNPFLYRKETVETDAPEKAFHDVRLDQEEPIYVSLIFPDSAHSVPYLSILEENPYETLQMKERYGGQALRLVSHMEQTFLIERLNKEIDGALKTGDHGRFHELTDQLKEVLENYKGETNDK
jgi:uncharacterized protein YpiB (UPF0302 family)